MTVQAAGLAGSKAIPQKTSSLEKPITIDVDSGLVSKDSKDSNDSNDSIILSMILSSFQKCFH